MPHPVRHRHWMRRARLRRPSGEFQWHRENSSFPEIHNPASLCMSVSIVVTFVWAPQIRICAHHRQMRKMMHPSRASLPRLCGVTAEFSRIDTSILILPCEIPALMSPQWPGEIPSRNHSAPSALLHLHLGTIAISDQKHPVAPALLSGE